MSKKIITGEWDGQHIYRDETAADRLAKAMSAMKLYLTLEDGEHKVERVIAVTDQNLDHLREIVDDMLHTINQIKNF